MKFPFSRFFLNKKDPSIATPILMFAMLGPLCLIFGLVSVLFKYAQYVWPIILVAFSGVFVTWKWKKTGFLFSLFLLTGIMFALLRTQEPFWIFLLSTSVALSWLLLFLGHQEVCVLINDKEKMLTTLKKKHDQFLLEIHHYQNNEKTVKAALEKTDAQLLEIQKQTQVVQEKQPLPAQQEEEESLVHRSLELLQVQYVQLKQQFEEKSEILHATRKQLFSVESQFLTLQKEVEEKSCCSHEALFHDLKQIEEEWQDLECQVSILQDVVTHLLPIKKEPKRKRKSSPEAQEDLFLMIQEKRDPFL